MAVTLNPWLIIVRIVFVSIIYSFFAFFTFLLNLAEKYTFTQIFNDLKYVIPYDSIFLTVKLSMLIIGNHDIQKTAVEMIQASRA